ncbi:hypothetical protein CBM2626_U20050 [Cupriavidus taiwanensis]|nr:hypothetical protein CBM2626_U20050 [Cupriavidus taiwanensis]SPA11695.1 protein of unknown function [Cupriavidus taiwanensis]SPA57597.1 protein of unknown function [Cupriavidus taiwanensis]
MFIAHDGFAWRQIGEPGQASAREQPADSGFGNTNTAGDLPLEHLPLENQQGLGWVNGPRRAPARHLPDGGPAPLASRECCNAMASECLAHTQAMFGDVLDHLESTAKGESGILMGVHPAELLESGCLVTFRFQTQFG